MSGEQEQVGALGPLVGYHLRRAFGAFAADFAAAMEGTGMRQGAVGRVLGIKRANMVSLINELVDLKLIARVVDPSDRRAFSLTVTDAGRAMLTDCLARIEAHEREMLAGLSEAERATLLDLLGRIERRDPTAG